MTLTHYPYSMYLRPLESRAVITRQGGLHCWDPEYAFWKKFLTSPNLKVEFVKRVSDSNGYIEWDFLCPRVFGMPPGQQYRGALHCVLAKLYNLRPPSYREQHEYLLPPPTGTSNSEFELVFDDPIEDLEYLRKESQRGIDWRKKNIDRYDTWRIWFRELYKKPTPTKNHKEIYRLWVMINKLVERKLRDFIAAESGIRPSYNFCNRWTLLIVVVVILISVGLILLFTGQLDTVVSYLKSCAEEIYNRLKVMMEDD